MSRPHGERKQTGKQASKSRLGDRRPQRTPVRPQKPHRKVKIKGFAVDVHGRRHSTATGAAQSYDGHGSQLDVHGRRRCTAAGAARISMFTENAAARPREPLCTCTLHPDKGVLRKRAEKVTHHSSPHRNTNRKFLPNRFKTQIWTQNCVAEFLHDGPKLWSQNCATELKRDKTRYEG